MASTTTPTLSNTTHSRRPPDIPPRKKRCSPSSLPPPPSFPHCPTGFLRTSGTKIVSESGTPILLRGCGLGGMLKMENFITGFPGHEVLHRSALHQVLGSEKYEAFFKGFYHHFFNSKDVRFLKDELGLNCVRVPFDYRHFEDDEYPMELKHDSVFEELDRVIRICGEAGVYTILDLHAAPGGQNHSWHSNNIGNVAGFWEHRHFRERALWLWGVIAERYKDNPWVAGYNPLNEPADGGSGFLGKGEDGKDVGRYGRGRRLVEWYWRVERVIRGVDQKHILYWDGNTFAMTFEGFEEEFWVEDDDSDGSASSGGHWINGIFQNSVYSIHDYCSYGFPRSPHGLYTGTPTQNARITAAYNRKVAFMKTHNLPIWNGEFGPVYANPEDDGPEWEAINDSRMKMLTFQLDLYQKEEIPWSIWLYKDIGFMGMVYTPAQSPWMKLVSEFVKKKRRNMIDQWGNNPHTADPKVEALFEEMKRWVEGVSPETARVVYPTTWGIERHLMRGVRETYLADALQGEFAGLFEGKSESELEDLLESFGLRIEDGKEGEGEKDRKGKVGWAVQRGYLNEVLRRHNGLME